MTYEEALNRFKRTYERIKDYYDPHWEGSEYREHREWVEQLGIAINALEKQIPKKPFRESLADRLCPVCGAYINFDALNEKIEEAPEYCSNCGQKIDWRDVK